VTAFARAGDQANATRAGFDGYIEKPISVRGLVADVQVFLRGGRS
jgi:two-component system cell cycle response regulator DivK